jgi:hypothetical protein
MNGYIFFYNGKRVELHADTLYDAHLKAIEHFKPPKSKRHMVHGMIAEKADVQVTHSTAIFG